MCDEMLSRSVPLRARTRTRRWAASSPLACFAQELVNGNMFVQFSGYGYAWTNADETCGLRRERRRWSSSSTSSSMATTLRLLPTSARRTRSEWKPLAVVSQPVAGAVLGMPITNRANSGPGAGPQLLRKAELSRGLHGDPRGERVACPSAPASCPRGKRPTVPFETVDGGERELLANERTEIHEGQRDFTGPFEVLSEDGQRST
jgi:hypothetical protein